MHIFTVKLSFYHCHLQSIMHLKATYNLWIYNCYTPQTFFTHKSISLRFNIYEIKCSFKCMFQWIVTDVYTWVIVTLIKTQNISTTSINILNILPQNGFPVPFSSHPHACFSHQVWLQIRDSLHFKLVPTLSTNQHALCWGTETCESTLKILHCCT